MINSQAVALGWGCGLAKHVNLTPILGVIGDQDDSEYTVIPIIDAVELLKTENSRAEMYQVEYSDHVFSGKEAEVIALIADFIKHKILVEDGYRAFVDASNLAKLEIDI